MGRLRYGFQRDSTPCACLPKGIVFVLFFSALHPGHVHPCPWLSLMPLKAKRKISLFSSVFFSKLHSVFSALLDSLHKIATIVLIQQDESWPNQSPSGLGPILAFVNGVFHSHPNLRHSFSQTYNHWICSLCFVLPYAPNTTYCQMILISHDGFVYTSLFLSLLSLP